MIIGGLIQDTRHRDRIRIPILSDLPVIGLLLQNLNEVEAQSEFVIYITLHLVTSAGEANQLFRPARSESEGSLDRAPSQNGQEARRRDGRQHREVGPRTPVE
ncbi:MAG: hypothetical protein IMW99_04730 [Firmicutes bacterium]|nr:hypothetical protein [Bacillota bacterium]